ncbi:MAG: FG-GAP repeat protein [Streptosporangiaceae bacterium]
MGKQLAELRGSGTIAGDNFGYAAAISGTAAVVGAYGHGNFAGRAYVFTKTATGWKQTASLKGSDTVAGDDFGTAVAISGITAVVGANGSHGRAGRAYVFTKTPRGWKQTAELKGSDTVARDEFGTAVAISGATAVVGAWIHAKSAGRAYVFTKTAAGWKQTAELKVPHAAADDEFGASVAVSGGSVVVGAPGPAKGGSSAYLFTRTRTGWTQVIRLTGSDTAASDAFGYSVAISGSVSVVGAYYHANVSGRAYVFTSTKAGWKQVAELRSSDATAGDMFGYRVGVSGTTAVVGALNHASFAGRAYLFTKTAAGWKQAAELRGSDTAAGDEFGSAVAISGTTAVVGAPGHAEAGRAYAFQA